MFTLEGAEKGDEAMVLREDVERFGKECKWFAALPWVVLLQVDWAQGSSSQTHKNHAGTCSLARSQRESLNVSKDSSERQQLC